MLKRFILKMDQMIENGLKLIAEDDDPPPHPPAAESVSQGFEVKDANCLGIALGAALLVVSAVFMHLILGLGFQNFKHHELNGDSSQSARPEDYIHAYSPTQPLSQYRSQMNDELNSYGWPNESADRKTVRVPIEKAMQWRANEK